MERERRYEGADAITSEACVCDFSIRLEFFLSSFLKRLRGMREKGTSRCSSTFFNARRIRQIAKLTQRDNILRNLAGLTIVVRRFDSIPDSDRFRPERNNIFASM